MISYKPSDSPSTSRSMHMNLTLPETPDRPTIGRSGNVESMVLGNTIRPRMPIITVGLDDQFDLLEHEVGLEAAEHTLVHLEMKTTPLELVIEGLLNGGHLSRECLPQSRLAGILLRFWSALSSTHILSCLGRRLHSKMDLAYSLSRFWRFHSGNLKLAALLPHLRGMLAAKLGLPRFLPMFRCLFVASFRHPMFNYNSNLTNQQETRFVSPRRPLNTRSCLAGVPQDCWPGGTLRGSER